MLKALNPINPFAFRLSEAFIAAYTTAVFSPWEKHERECSSISNLELQVYWPDESKQAFGVLCIKLSFLLLLTL